MDHPANCFHLAKVSKGIDSFSGRNEDIRIVRTRFVLLESEPVEPSPVTDTCTERVYLASGHRESLTSIVIVPTRSDEGTDVSLDPV